MAQLKTIQWKQGKLVLIDQTLLPNQIVYEEFETVEDTWEAIKVMKVRGAPAIGIAAAYGLFLGVKNVRENDFDSFHKVLKEKADYLCTSRPTAMNLFWAMQRMVTKALANKNLPVSMIKNLLEQEAVLIHREDEEINRLIGENLLTLLEDGMGILTYCNAGALATSKYGTATAPIYLAKEKGWEFNVYCCETRPRLQGSTLTALELTQADVDVTLITDNMAAMVMSQGKIDAVIVGCDRLAANGDFANKIGTLAISIIARHYEVPFYVATPSPTIDLNAKTGLDIPIEERPSWEITNRFGVLTAPENIKTYNPSFDVTLNENITAIITEKGIIYPPFEKKLKNYFDNKCS